MSQENNTETYEIPAGESFADLFAQDARKRRRVPVIWRELLLMVHLYCYRVVGFDVFNDHVVAVLSRNGIHRSAYGVRWWLPLL